MKKTMKKHFEKWSCLFLVLGVAAASTANAQKEVGNGGDSVVCYTASDRKVIKSVEMFDYWEMNNSLPQVGGISLGGPQLTVKEKIGIALSRLEKFDPELKELVAKTAYLIADNVGQYLVSSYQLPEIDDANPRALPSGNCFIEQFAVQWKEPSNGQRRFLIADKFYNSVKTSNDARAGIILHEAIYRFAMGKGQTNSDNVRYFNFVLSSAMLDGKSDIDYLNAYLQAKFAEPGCEIFDFYGRKMLGISVAPSYGYLGNRMLCTSLNYQYQAQKLKLSPFRRSVVMFENNYAVVGYSELERSMQFRLSQNSIVSAIEPNGLWRSIRIVEDTPLTVDCHYMGCFPVRQNGSLMGFNYAYDKNGDAPLKFNLKYQNTLVDCKGVQIYLDTNGEVVSCRIKQETILPHAPQNLLIAGDTLLERYLSGQLKYVTLAAPALLETASLQQVNLSEEVWFHQNERVGRGTLLGQTSFKVPGKNQNVVVNEDFELNSVGEITKGHLVTPVTKTLFGQNFTVKDVAFTPSGQLKFDDRLRFTFSSVLYQGKRVMDSYGYDVNLKVCQSIDSRLKSSRVQQTKEVLVVGTEQFYNGSKGLFVAATDEYVTIIDQLSCEAGNVTIDL